MTDPANPTPPPNVLRNLRQHASDGADGCEALVRRYTERKDAELIQAASLDLDDWRSAIAWLDSLIGAARDTQTEGDAAPRESAAVSVTVPIEDLEDWAGAPEHVAAAHRLAGLNAAAMQPEVYAALEQPAPPASRSEPPSAATPEVLASSGEAPIIGTVFYLGGEDPEPPPEGKIWAQIAVPLPEGRALPLYGSVRILVGKG